MILKNRGTGRTPAMCHCSSSVGTRRIQLVICESWILIHSVGKHDDGNVWKWYHRIFTSQISLWNGDSCNQKMFLKWRICQRDGLFAELRNKRPAGTFVLAMVLSRNRPEEQD